MRVPWAWLENASYPVVIDPTIDDQIDDSYNDAHERATGANFSYTDTIVRMQSHVSDSYFIWHTGARFENITINNWETIDVAYFSVLPFTGNDDPHVDIYCEDVDDSDDFNTTQDVLSRTNTRASIDWDETDIGISWNNSPSIVNPVQEVIERSGWSSGNSLTLLIRGSFQSGNMISDK